MALWGNGLYGQGLYSADTPGSADLAGDLAPVISLQADLTIVNKVDLGGDLAPAITFGGDLSYLVNSMVGDLAPVVTFSGTLISGPLWTPTPPCDPVDWKEAELCNG